MELSAIIKEYNLPLTRSESSLVAQLPTGPSTVSNDLYDRRMKALADARNMSKQLPDRRTLERQDKMDKAGMLSQRLKILRQMLPFMSPSAVKSLMAEMKQIAAQLAPLGGATGSTGGAIPQTVKSGDSIIEDRQLKETVEELKNQYSAALAAMKRKQQSGRGSGQLAGHNPHLHVYADMTDSTGSVTVKV